MTREAEIFRRLTAHAARRRAGIPTVSVLVGPPALAARVVDKWVESREGAAAESAPAGASPSGRVARFEIGAPVEEVARAWVAAHDPEMLRDRACAVVARREGISVERVEAALRTRSAHERAVWLDEVFPDTEAPEAVACRALLGAPFDPGRSARGDPPREAMFRGLFELAGEASPVVLLGVAGENDCSYSDSGLHAGSGARALPPGVAALAELSSSIPALPIAIAVPNAWKTAIETASRPSAGDSRPSAGGSRPSAGGSGGRADRAVSVLAEGIVEIGSLDAAGIAARLRDSGAPQVPAAAVARLAQDGASPELVDLFAAAAVASGSSAPEVPEDRARSAAERFLFERLATLPATAGLFELNQRVRGEGSWEVDLLACEAKIAIEIDGYFHFRDADAYRVDRRKDLFLQQHGYLVLRFLAADVVSRLPEILAAVTGALRGRRDRAKREAEK